MCVQSFSRTEDSHQLVNDLLGFSGLFSAQNDFILPLNDYYVIIILYDPKIDIKISKKLFAVILTVDLYTDFFDLHILQILFPLYSGARQ